MHAEAAVNAGAVEAHLRAERHRRPRRILGRAVEASLRAEDAAAGHSSTSRWCARAKAAASGREGWRPGSGGWPGARLRAGKGAEESCVPSRQRRVQQARTRLAGFFLSSLKISSRMACGTSASGSGLPLPLAISSAIVMVDIAFARRAPFANFCLKKPADTPLPWVATSAVHVPSTANSTPIDPFGKMLPRRLK